MRRAPTILIALLPGNYPLTGVGAAQREQGTLEIHIKDHRDAIGDFSILNITIEKFLISPKPGLKFWRTDWHGLPATPDTIDLTQYVGGAGVKVFRGAIDAGGFEAFHLKIKRIEGRLKKNQRSATVKNTVGAVKLSFEVYPKGETLLIIDLVVTDFSDHPPRGYELGLKGYELYTGGKLIAKVPPG
ncbi:MAG: DUF4382 domain-containing protein [Candidatus Binatia bacterium]